MTIAAKRARSRTTPSTKSSTRVTGARASCEHPKMQLTQCSSIWRRLQPHQREAVEFADRVRTAALFLGQRTGKTWITLALIERLASSTLFTTVLVVAPLSNLESTWGKHLAELLPHVHVARSVEQFKAIERAPWRHPAPIVLLVHYEGLPKALRFACKRRWSLIVYDESQRLKSRSTRQARDAHKLRHSSARKLILSGTPIDERPTDLWSQFKFLRPQLLGDRWADFEDDWLERVDDLAKRYRPGTMAWHRALMVMQIKKRKRSIDPAKLSQFVSTIQPFCMRVLTEDVIDLSGLEYIHSPVKLRGKQRELYEELKTNAVASVHKLTAPFKLTLLTKLSQICGGYVINDEGDVLEVGRAKLRAVKSIVDRQESRPVVIFCRYIEEVQAIRRELPETLRVETMTGQTKKGQRPSIIDRFQRGLIDVLVCQIKVGGVGIDLWRAQVAIIYSTTYSWIDFDQAVKRLVHKDRRSKIQIFLVYAWKTIDETILRKVMNKDHVTAKVLNQLKGPRTWQRKRRLF